MAGSLLTILSLATSLAHADVHAQPQNEDDFGSIVRVSAPGENVNQLWAHADPSDGQHLIACGSFQYPQSSVWQGYIYSSPDSGATWQRTLLDDSTRWVTEASCAYGENGRAYFADGESDTSTGRPRHEWGHLQLFTSDDHGMTWKRAGRRGFVDWTVLASLPADREHAASLIIFGNAAADKPGHWWKRRPVALEVTDGGRSISGLVTPTIVSKETLIYR